MTDEKKKTKLTKEQALAAMLDDFELEHLESQAKAMSDEEIMEDLAKEGLPKERVLAMFAKQDAMIRADQEKRARAKPARTPFMRSFRGGMTVGVGLAAMAALVALFFHVVSVGPEAIHAERPAETRRQVAFIECGKAHWQACLDGLDQAQALDPTSDSQKDVKNARAIATAALLREADAGPDDDDASPTPNTNRKRPPPGWRPDGGGTERP